VRYVTDKLFLDDLVHIIQKESRDLLMQGFSYLKLQMSHLKIGGQTLLTNSTNAITINSFVKFREHRGTCFGKGRKSNELVLLILILLQNRCS
jgi:nitrate/nitrite-specific signal transduction histidine kinase